MSSVQPPRPWWVLDSLCDDYLALVRNGGDLKMLQVLKVIRGITLNFLLAATSVFMVIEGGDPTVIGLVGLTGLMVVNGVEAADYLAAKQALEEAKQTADDD